MKLAANDKRPQETKGQILLSLTLQMSVMYLTPLEKLNDITIK